MSVESLIKDLIKAIKESDKRKTEPYDTVATVKRVKDGTAWVHIPSGIDETPVKLTVNAKAGDKVQVRVGGGKAWITGNATAPPTDDTTAVKARYEAQSAKQSAVEAKIEAVKSAGTATEYLSVESDGVFVHAKDMPKDPTDSEARGVLIDDDVEIIREGESVASFGEDVLLGKGVGQRVSRLKISSTGLSIPSTNGDAFQVRTVFSGSSQYPIGGEILFNHGQTASIGIFNDGSAHQADPPRDGSLNIDANSVCVKNARFTSDGLYPQYDNAEPMGTIYTSEAGSTSIPNGSWTLVSSNGEGYLYLSKGIYIVSAAVTFPSNATGRRGVRISTYTARSKGIGGPQTLIEEFTGGSQIVGASSNGVIRPIAFVAGIDLLEYEENGAFVVIEAYQNSGSAMTISNAYIRAIRIV